MPNHAALSAYLAENARGIRCFGPGKPPLK